MQNIMYSTYASERIMVLSVIVMAGDHLQSMLCFPIMAVMLFVTMSTGGVGGGGV